MSKRLAQSPDSTDTPHSLAPYKSSFSKVGSSLSNQARSRKKKIYPSPDDVGGSGYPYPYKNSSYSGKTGSNKNEGDPKPSKKRVKSKLQRVKLAVKIALGLVLVAGGVLCANILKETLMKHLEMDSVWNLHPQPKVVTADNFLIASSSESCNEWIKTVMVMKTMKLPTVAALMSLCLAVAEPHNSGAGAHALSVYVDAKKKKCLQTQGHYMIGKNLEETVDAVRLEYKNHLQGPYSVAMPGFISNLIGYARLQNYDANDIQEFKNSISAFNAVLNGNYLPVSESMSNAVLHSGLDAAFTFMRSFGFTHDDNVVYQQGDIFLGSSTLLAHAEQVVEYMTLNSTHPYIHVAEKFNADSAQKYAKGAYKFGGHIFDYDGEALKMHEEESRVLRGKKTNINGYIVCSANTPTSSSFVVDALKSHAKRFKKHADKSDPMKILHNVEFYKDLFDTVNHTSGLFKDFSKIKGFAQDDKFDFESLKNLKALHKREREKESELKKKHRKRTLMAETESYGANTFVVIDVKEQQAIASAASFGSSLGSLVSDAEDVHLFNNLLAHLGADLEHVGPVVHPLQPLIAYKNGTIALALAGSGGALTRSLDMARTIATAALRLIFDIPIEKAVTVPLIFPSENKAQYTPGIPSPELTEMSNHLKKHYPQLEKRKRRTDAGKAWKRVDRMVVASSDGKTAKGVFYDDGKVEMLPAAL